MNALGPRLPTELVDAVIDNALEGCLFSDDFSGLSSYALVGRLWRDRVNSLRYRGLCIYLGGHTTAQLQALADICTTNIWPAHEGVARKVQHCTLARGCKESGDDDMFDGSRAREEAIVAVLRSIFRNKIHRARFSFRLQAGKFYTGERYGVCYFNTLGPNIITAVEDLLRTTYIRTLHVECIRGIPWSFVSSFVTLKDLSLDEVKFRRKKKTKVAVASSENCLMQKLIYITMKDCPSFIKALTSQKFGPPPHVSTMEIAYFAEHREKVFHRALYLFGSTLESLVISITGGFSHLSKPINYRKFLVLDYLDLDIEVDIDHGGRYDHEPLPLPAFQNVVQFLPPMPLKKMEITFAVSVFFFNPPDSLCCRVEDIYSRIYHKNFLQYLERITANARDTTINVVLFLAVHMDPGVVYAFFERYEEHKEYLLGQFSHLTGIRGVDFEVRVERIDDLPRFRWRSVTG